MLLPHQLAGMKLGCATQPGTLPPVANVAAAVAPPPSAYARISEAPRVQGHNDVCGDCVETAASNSVQTALARAGIFTRISDDYPRTLYSNLTGYRDGIPSTDNGTDPMVLFDWWRRNALGGFKLTNLTRLEPTEEGAIRHAIATDGGVYLIVNLSVEQQNQRVWMPAGTPGTWGGHAIWADEYDGGLTFCTSWGEPTPLDRSYFTTPGFVIAAFQLGLTKVS